MSYSGIFCAHLPSASFQVRVKSSTLLNGCNCPFFYSTLIAPLQKVPQRFLQNTSQVMIRAKTLIRSISYIDLSRIAKFWSMQEESPFLKAAAELLQLAVRSNPIHSYQILLPAERHVEERRAMLWESRT